MTTRQLKELLATAGLSLIATPRRESQNGHPGDQNKDAERPRKVCGSAPVQSR
jgi:hypothetical protein